MFVGVLGAFEATVAGTAVRLERRQQRLLLALLALNANTALPADRIAELLWDDEPPPTARNHVQVLVSASRKAVRAAGEERAVIGTSALGYHLDAPPAEVDLLAFEQDVARADQAVAAGHLTDAGHALRSALSRWRGRPLGDLTGRFAETESARLSERRVAVDLRWIDVELVLGRVDHLVAELTRRCADWPLHEGLRSRLVAALYAAGRPADALHAYRTGARLLGEEQGMVRPGERLRAAHEAVLRGDSVEEVVAAVVALPMDVRAPVSGPAPPQARPGQLPPDVTDFTGRDDCVAWLARSGPGVNVLSGTAGVGKTAAAVHWAHQARDRFPDGQLYLDLRGFSADPPMPEGEALARMLGALGVAPADLPGGVDAQADLFRSLTADRRVLVVLDNAASPGQVRPLLPGGTTSQAVITSRGLMSGLVAREGARRLVLELLPEDDAVRLLSRVIGAARADDEPVAVRELVRQCARLPLALRVLAERIAARPGGRLADLSAELTVQRRTLDVLTVADDETAAMRPVFSWSYHALVPDSARLFRLLGLHAGPYVSGPVAAALAGVADAGDLLDRLTGAHLLTAVGQDRYQYHDLLRCYARELAERHEERERAVRDMLVWYLLTADAANTALMPQRMAVPITAGAGVAAPLRFDSPDLARAWFEAEHANLVAAVAQAAEEGLHDIAWQLPATLWSFFYLSKRWSDWISTHTTGLESARRCADTHGEARMLHSLGTAAWNQGLPGEARRRYDQALAIWRGDGDRLGESQTLNNLGAALCAQRAFDEALVCYRRALRLRTEIGDRRGQGQTLNNLGEAHRELSQFDAAIEYFEQALEIHHEVADPFGQSETLANLGVLCREVGRAREAVGYFTRALAACRTMGDPLGVAANLIDLGRTLRETGDIRQARESWSDASAVLATLLGADAARLRADLADLTGDQAYAGPR